MGLSLAYSVSLTYTIKFFKEHTLQRLCPKVEKDCPCLCYRLLVNVYKVKLVDVAVN
jgi:hypothetical protein